MRTLDITRNIRIDGAHRMMDEATGTIPKLEENDKWRMSGKYD
jgi:hypothetical protein